MQGKSWGGLIRMRLLGRWRFLEQGNERWQLASRRVEWSNVSLVWEDMSTGMGTAWWR
jgi:hypothetical protein